MATSVNTLDSLQILVVGRYIDMAAGSLIIFDSLLTLDLERKFIWKSKWNMMKVMYIANRYSAILQFIVVCILRTQTDTTHCPGFMKAQGVLHILGIYFAEYIFAMRTYVICGKRKIFWIPTAIFGVGTLLYKFISYYLTLNHVQYIILPPFNGCLADLLPSAASMSVVFLVAYDAAMTLFIGWVAFGMWRTDDRVWNHVFKVLYGEGVLFYTYLLALSIAAVVAASISNPYLFIFMGRCVRSALASRVTLHIRQMFHRRNKESLSLGNTNSQ